MNCGIYMIYLQVKIKDFKLQHMRIDFRENDDEAVDLHGTQFWTTRLKTMEKRWRRMINRQLYGE